MTIPAHEMNTTCPFCGCKHELASNLTGPVAPEDGDLTMCVRCGEWAFFDSGVLLGGLRKPTDEEYETLNGDERCRKIREAWVLTKEKRDERHAS